MKRLLFLLFCFPILGFGQFGSIVSLSVSPTIPTETDTVYVYADLMFTSSDCELFIKSDYTSVNNIVASTQHCLGLFASICNITDTFKISPLYPGIYTFDLTLSSGVGGPPCTPGIVPNDYDTLVFNVTSTVSLEESLDFESSEIRLKKITNVLGQVVGNKTNTILFYIYDNGLVERKIIIK